ncbi:MAG TPA: Holliday junction resolvase RuvX [Kofleriaceae bacterium]|nr:Holliday junction resolvase RuvX [Kofleriaceae bacterium]
MRALGLDIGMKTIGIAMTDEVGIAAHPVRVLVRAGNAPDAREVVALCGEHAITDVVVGMPFELSGRIGMRARRVQVFVTELQKLLPGGIAIHEQDERFTTAEAERVLVQADVSRSKRKTLIDQQAATLILQGWLDGQRRAK